MIYNSNTRHVWRREVCRGFGRETKEQAPLGRPRRRWENNLLGAFKKENSAQHRKNGRTVLTKVMISQIS